MDDVLDILMRNGGMFVLTALPPLPLAPSRATRPLTQTLIFDRIYHRGKASSLWENTTYEYYRCTGTYYVSSVTNKTIFPAIHPRVTA